MFSSKHKNTAFFNPLNQFSNVCQMSLKAIPGLNKAFKNFLTRHVVADAYFSVHDFANGLEENGFHLVSRFRSDVALMYLYNGERTGKRGRPKLFDGRINFKELDPVKVTKVDLFPAEGDFYTTIAYSKSLKRMCVWSCSSPGRGSSSPASATARSATSPSLISLSIRLSQPSMWQK